MPGKRTFSLLLISALALSFSVTAMAQENNTSDKPAAPTPQTAPQLDNNVVAQRERDRPLEAYHLEFTLRELEGNKTINAREYSLDISTNDSNEIKIGARVPVESKQGEFQYLDVGTSIYARLEDRHGQAKIWVKSEMSSFALDEQDKHDTHPLIRQIKIDASTVLQLNKPILMGSADDPNSKHRFQLEMTATKM